MHHSKQLLNDGESTVTTHHWDGSTKAAYIRGLGLVAQQVDDQKYFYLHNGHGDVVQRVDAQGNVLHTYKYDAFGNEISPAFVGDPLNPIWSDPNPFRYCGEYFDDETGEIYLRARYYNPAIGRFGSEDIAKDGLNWYVYCANSPIMLADASGKRIVVAGTEEDQNTTLSYLNELTDHTLAYNADGEIYISEFSDAGLLPAGNMLIERLIANKQHTTTIQISPLGRASTFDGDGSASQNGLLTPDTLISYNIWLPPSQVATVDNLGFVTELSKPPMYIILGHELIHADRAMRGVGEPRQKRNFWGQVVENNIDIDIKIGTESKQTFIGELRIPLFASESVWREEAAAVGLGAKRRNDITENMLRFEHELPQRGAYSYRPPVQSNPMFRSGRGRVSIN